MLGPEVRLWAVSTEAQGAAARGRHRRPARPRLPTPTVAAVRVSLGDSSTSPEYRLKPATAVLYWSPGTLQARRKR